MWEESGLEDVVMTMNRIGSPHKGNSEATTSKGLIRCNPVFICFSDPAPSQRVFIVIRPTTATVKYRTNFILSHFLRGDFPKIRLQHLANFFIKSHLCKNLFDSIFNRFVFGNDAMYCRPIGKVRCNGNFIRCQRDICAQ